MADEEENAGEQQEASNPEAEVGSSKKKLLIVGVILALLLVGGGVGGFLMLSSGDEATTEEVIDTGEGEAEGEGGEGEAEGEGGEGEAEGEGGEGEAEGEGGEGEKKDEKADKADKDDEDLEEEDEFGFGKTIKFKMFNLNLGNPLENHYVRLEISVEVRSPKAEKEIQVRKSQLRDAIVSIVSHKTREFLLNPDGKEQLRHEILLQLNHYMKNKIERVFITDILIE